MTRQIGWAELLSADSITVGAGCDPGSITAAEAVLGCALPDELRSYLLAVNGVYDAGGEYCYGWTLDQIVAAAPELRESGLPADLVAFGDNGCGEPFCVRSGDPSPTCDVYHWSPIGGEVTRVAASLQVFWHGWLDGTIST